MMFIKRERLESSLDSIYSKLDNSGNHCLFFIDYSNWCRWHTSKNDSRIASLFYCIFGCKQLYTRSLTFMREATLILGLQNCPPPTFGTYAIGGWKSGNSMFQVLCEIITFLESYLVFEDYYKEVLRIFSGDNINALVTVTSCRFQGLLNTLHLVKEYYHYIAESQGRFLKAEECWFSSTIMEFLQRRYYLTTTISDGLSK